MIPKNVNILSSERVTTKVIAGGRAAKHVHHLSHVPGNTIFIKQLANDSINT